MAFCSGSLPCFSRAPFPVSAKASLARAARVSKDLVVRVPDITTDRRRKIQNKIQFHSKAGFGDAIGRGHDDIGKEQATDLRVDPECSNCPGISGYTGCTISGLNQSSRDSNKLRYSRYALHSSPRGATSQQGDAEILPRWG